MYDGLPCEEKGAMAIFPLHPRESLWGGRHTPAEQRMLREWMKAHPLETDGKVQRSLWAYFGGRKRKLNPEEPTTCGFEPAQTASLSRSRSCDFAPFFNPSDQLTECLRDLAIASYTDVAVANGTLCSVGVTAKAYAGEYWSAYSPT